MLTCVTALTVWAVSPHYECVDYENAAQCDQSCNCPAGYGKCCLKYDYVGTCSSCIQSQENGWNQCTPVNPCPRWVPCTVYFGDCIDYSDDGEWYSDMGCTCTNFDPPSYGWNKCCDC